ncbi:hypothetical protein FQR65_LT09438 [Abscondita terminalis]|nr:hypothetical protein FQR65_LT09438 [Abscondita terminalis]
MTDPVVTVKNGKLRGKVANNYDGDEYYSFQGIPYAKPPIGPLRFRPPVPSESWNGVKDATEIGDDCVAFYPIINRSTGAEDCLFLNVYTKELPDVNRRLKPVMFWIHGGAFMLGSGSSVMYGPNFLLTKDIVLVTINYRLGLLGFLNFEDVSLGVSGNMGLKDQVLALKWVRENISQFNGDPDNVTIFGESAGAASVHYLLLSPQTKDLYHKCIIQSGCASAWWAKGHPSLPFITKALGMEKTSNEKEVLNILQNMPIEDIIELQKNIFDEFEPSTKRCFGPVVEYTSPHSFLSEEPELLINSGKYHHVPIIIGFTSREGMVTELFNKYIRSNKYDIQNLESQIPHTLNVENGTELSKMVANKIQKFYFGNDKAFESYQTQYYLLQGDAGFLWPIVTTVKQLKATSKAPVYFYRMSVDSNLNPIKKLLEINSPGVSHGDDLGYLFNNMFAVEIIPNSVEEKVMRTFVKLWTNFATNGDPNSSPKDDLINIYWKPVRGNDLDYLDIGENLTTGINPEQNRLRFWDELTIHKAKL